MHCKHAHISVLLSAFLPVSPMYTVVRFSPTDVQCNSCAVSVYGQRGSYLPPTLNPLRDSITQENGAMKRTTCNLTPAHPRCKYCSIRRTHTCARTHAHTHSGGDGCRADRKRRIEVSNKWGKATPPSILGLSENNGSRQQSDSSTCLKSPPLTGSEKPAFTHSDWK